MKRLNKIFISLLLLSAFQIKAQDVYRTQDAQMVITAIAKDTILKIKNTEILVLLNYENARFTMKMDKADFKTGIDSLDKKIALHKYEIIEYKGKFDLNEINTNGHPPLDFDIEGVISTNQNIIKGKGHLEHIANRGKYSCLLTMKFSLTLDELGLSIEGLNLDDEIEIEIVDSVLNKSSNY